jgi:cytochrome c biogenesis protein
MAAGARGQELAHELLRWLASPRWMLGFFVFAAAGALVSVQQPDWITPVWMLPLGVFALSLLAAVASNSRLRKDAALLGLHLGLLLFVLLLGAARLTYFDGAVTLTQGAPFEGRLDLDRRGPLHPGGVEALRFANEGFTEEFGERARWKSTRNRVRWWNAQGRSEVAEIGDDHPLVLGGYRIYTTHNRGYSPVFRWTAADGREELGTVQLRAGEFDQANSWQLPGGPEIWAMLAPAEQVALARGARRVNLGEDSLAHRLVIRAGARRELLQPGGSLDLPGGRLTYVALESWMGYRIVYDVAMYWLMAAATVTLVCMTAFYARLLRRGWQDAGEEE